MRILVVDDEEDILSSIGTLLSKSGHDVKTTPSGREALGLVRTGKFDLVLLDVLMPEISGREVLERIRADPETRGQKVAMLTVVQLSHAGEKIIRKLRPVEYFQKPIDVDDFLKRVARVLGE